MGEARTTGTALVERKSFDTPDEASDPYEKVHVATVQVMGQAVRRVTVQPGWNWTEHGAPVAASARCPYFHVKLFVAGRFGLAYEDGTEVTFGPGDIGVIQPEHDAWVVGDEPVVYFALGDLFEAASAG